MAILKLETPNELGEDELKMHEEDPIELKLFCFDVCSVLIKSRSLGDDDDEQLVTLFEGDVVNEEAEDEEDEEIREEDKWLVVYTRLPVD